MKHYNISMTTNYNRYPLYKWLFFVFYISLFLSACKDKSKPTNENAQRDTTIVQNNTQPLPSQADSNSIDAEVDISPMDMSYFPPKYPQHKMAGTATTAPIMRIIYSRPHLQGRHLFEDIIKYGQTWRLGANEATELDLFQTVTIGDKKLQPGRYVLYAIPKAGYWTIVVNSDLDMWGLKQDSTQDIVHVQVPVTFYNPIMEYFTMVFEKTATGANLIIAWDDVVAKLPIKI